MYEYWRINNYGRLAHIEPYCTLCRVKMDYSFGKILEMLYKHKPTNPLFVAFTTNAEIKHHLLLKRHFANSNVWVYSRFQFSYIYVSFFFACLCDPTPIVLLKKWKCARNRSMELRMEKWVQFSFWQKYIDHSWMILEYGTSGIGNQNVVIAVHTGMGSVFTSNDRTRNICHSGVNFLSRGNCPS